MLERATGGGINWEAVEFFTVSGRRVFLKVLAWLQTAFLAPKTHVLAPKTQILGNLLDGFWSHPWLQKTYLPLSFQAGSKTIYFGSKNTKFWGIC